MPHPAAPPPPKQHAQPRPKPAALRLLRTIDALDRGDGVEFHSAPRGRWRLPGTGYTVNDATFGALERDGLIDVGNGHSDPVKITAAGRTLLTRLALHRPQEQNR